MKIEKGIMVMHNGMAWGCVYEDGHSTAYGWMSPEDAPIHDAKYVSKPTDVTWRGSQYREELKKGKLVEVIRTTTVTVKEVK
jgi:hypothetical protein